MNEFKITERVILYTLGGLSAAFVGVFHLGGMASCDAAKVILPLQQVPQSFPTVSPYGSPSF